MTGNAVLMAECVYQRAGRRVDVSEYCSRLEQTGRLEDG